MLDFSDPYAAYATKDFLLDIYGIPYTICTLAFRTKNTPRHLGSRRVMTFFRLLSLLYPRVLPFPIDRVQRVSWIIVEN